MNFLEKYLYVLPKPLRNKYALVAFLFFGILFFGKNDVRSQIKLSGTIRDLKAQKQQYKQDIVALQASREALFKNKKELEKYARTRYFMKRTQEDVYVFEE